MDQRVFEQCEKSMVRLHYGEAFLGTGIVVHAEHDECMIMTCGHVVMRLRNGENPNAYLSGENDPFECAVLSWDIRLTDAALLQSVSCDRSFDSVTPLEFFEGEAVTPGMAIVLLAFYSLEDGNPMLRAGTSPGSIIGNPRGGQIVYSASSKPGTSGGAIICSKGGSLYVAGIHAETDETTCYATSVQAIGGFLLDWVNYLSQEEEDKIDVADIKTMLEMGPRLSGYAEADADKVEEPNTDDDDEV